MNQYSNFGAEQEEQAQGFIDELKLAANDATRWAIIGANNPAAPKSRMKHPMVEKYGEMAIDLGVNNEMESELNCSPEGKLRRKALKDKDEAEERQTKFRLQMMEAKEEKPSIRRKDGTLNTSLK